MIETDDFVWYVGIGLTNLTLSLDGQGLKITGTKDGLTGEIYLEGDDIKRLQRSLKMPVIDGIIGGGYVITFDDFTFQFSDAKFEVELVEEDFKAFTNFILNIQ